MVLHEIGAVHFPLRAAHAEVLAQPSQSVRLTAPGFAEQKHDSTSRQARERLDNTASSSINLAEQGSVELPRRLLRPNEPFEICHHGRT
ncbi:hypothetical protein GCM10027610_082220 [Dactylosporangium cerinum]